MHKKIFVVEITTDNPNDISAAEIHLALLKYFVMFVGIDVKEIAQPSKQADKCPTCGVLRKDHFVSHATPT